MNESKLLFWFEELGQGHNEVVGKKGENLGEIFNLGMPVAPGFAVSLDACYRFMSETGAHEEVSRYWKKARADGRSGKRSEELEVRV